MNHKRAYDYLLPFLPALLLLIALGVAISTARAAITNPGKQGQLFEVAGAGDPVCPVDLSAYWKLDEGVGITTFDDSVGTKDGTCTDTGCPTPVVSGMFGGAQVFDGNVDKIQIPYSADFDWGSGDSFSFEFWMKAGATTCATTSEVILGRIDGTSKRGWWVGCATGGAARFELSDTGTTTAIVDGPVINDGAWHHLAAVRSASDNKIYLYVDGVAASTNATYTANFAFGTAPLHLGWHEHPDQLNRFYFDGTIDEVAIYDRVLTADEVAYHFEGGVEGGDPRRYCNSAPAFSAQGNRTDSEGATINLDIDATDPESDTVTYSATNLPDGLSIDPSTGVISGTIGYNEHSSSPFSTKITATDAGSPAAYNELTFQWTVTNANAAPEVTKPADQANAEGETILPLQIVATDPDSEDVPKYYATGLPSGLSIGETTGIISGTISKTASTGSPYSVTVTVKDDGTPPMEDSETFSWTVSISNEPPEIVNPGDRSNTEGESISLEVEASDPDGDSMNFSAVGLPLGLSINANSGEISGIISHLAYTGTPYSVTITVTDDGEPEKSDSASFEWTIIDDNRTPEITKPANRTDLEGAAITLEIEASDEDSDNTLTYSAENLPPGLSIDEDTGEISGVISAGAASGSPYSVTVTVTDDGSPAKEASATFTWTVLSEEGVEIFLPLIMK
jgi:hypothetical protein